MELVANVKSTKSPYFKGFAVSVLSLFHTVWNRSSGIFQELAELWVKRLTLLQ